MKKLLVAIIAVLWASFAYAQFNGCKAGFCPGGIFGGGSSPESILPPSMQSNPPDIYANLKTNKAYVKGLSYNPPATDYINVSRASAATQVDSSGNWIQCLSSVLCRTDLGASIWEARTNSIRNNTMAGAVVMADNVQLLQNNDFASGAANWASSTSGGGAVTFNTGSVVITGDGSTDGNYISQQLTGLTVGRNYVVVIVAANGTPRIGVGTTQGAPNTVAFVNAAPNGLNSTSMDRIAFTATQTSHWVSFSRFTASAVTITSVAVYDGERIQNGTFAVNPINAAQNTVQNGWSWAINGGTSTVTYNGTDAISLNPDGVNFSAADVSFPSVSGFTYTLNVALGANIAVQAGTAKGTNSLLNVTTTGTVTLQLTATTSTTWIRFSRATVAGGAATIKNVSVLSAGKLPNNWSQFFGGTGLIRNIVATGTTNGVNTIDIRWNGTTGSTSLNLGFENVAVVSALYGQTWNLSTFLGLVGGSLTNLGNVQLALNYYTSGPGFINTYPSAVLNGSLTSSLQRFDFNKTLGDSATASILPYLSASYSSGVAVDFTFRFGWPQLENNSLIASSVASAVKAADGSGGVDGTAIYLVGGGAGTTPAQLNVTWAAGVMSVNSVAQAGIYTTFPPSPATLTYVSGVATGWTGATVTLTPTDNSAKAAASNPILTTSAAATRVAEADTLILTGLPAIGSAASLWGRFTPLVPAAYPINQYVVSLDDGSLNNRMNVFRNNQTAGSSYRYVSSGVTGISATSAALNSNISNSIAIAGTTGSQAGYSNGGNSVTGAGVGFPSATTVHIGVAESGGTGYANTNMEELAIWFSQRVPNAQLQSMTQ